MASWSDHMYPVMEQFLTVQGEGLIPARARGSSVWVDAMLGVLGAM